jgi:hypothetical protein
MKEHALVSLALILATTASLAADSSTPGFSKRPAVAKSGDAVTIMFAASRETDVAVAIEDAGGRITRHLAAGLLGPKAPLPLKAGSLEQSLVWDGKDDDGATATNGPFLVRVGLGLKASWGGLAFTEPGKTGPNMLEHLVTGLAVGPDGRVYVGQPHGTYSLGSVDKTLIFRRDGAYERTIMPYAPTLPMDRIAPAGAFLNALGRVNPRHGPYTHRQVWFYPVNKIGFQTPAVGPDGTIYMAGDGGKTGGVVTVIDPDGGVPAASYAGPALGRAWLDAPFLAIASDAKALYATRLATMGAKGVVARESHAVYRISLPARGPAETFFGEPDTAGSDNQHLNDPRAVALDGAGHVLIADGGNNRIVVLNEADRSVAGLIPLEGALWVGVHRKSGAVYAYGKAGRVVKFAGWKSQQETYGLPLPSAYEPGLQRKETSYLALDAAAEPPVLWAGIWDAKKGALFLRFEDDGAKFTEPAPAGYYRPPSPRRPCADPTHRLVASVVNGKFSTLNDEVGTNTTVALPGSFLGYHHRLDRDGNIYGIANAAPLRRFGRDGKPMPFPATAADPLLKGDLPVGNRGNSAWERDFWIDRRGTIYVNRQSVIYHGLDTLEVFDQLGNYKRTALWSITDGMYGPRVDAKGNIVVLDSVEPPGQPFPKEFTGVEARLYDWFYGSVIKFGPSGGAAWKTNDDICPADFENWRSYGRVINLRTAGGSLTGNIVKGWPHPAGIILVPGREGTLIDADKCKTVSLRLKNDSDGTRAVLAIGKESIISDQYPPLKTIEVKPRGDFAEYTFDLSDVKEWKGLVRTIAIHPSDTKGEGTFAIDWIRIGTGDSQKTYNFNAEESYATKLPSGLQQQPIRASHWLPQGTLLGAEWIYPGVSAVSAQGYGECHCFGTDLDMDDFGRIFAPDSLRFRVLVLDANGNEITSIGAYGNQDFCGPESYVIDPATKLLRPRRADDPKELKSPFSQPEIAFAWINGVAVTDRHAFVTDLINKRILRLKLGYEAEESCPLK